MQNKMPLLGILVLLSTASVVSSRIIVDYTCTEVAADGTLVEIIPQTYLDKARQLKILFCHASVGGTIMNGMTGRQGLANQNPQRYQINTQQDAAAAWFDANDGIVNISHTGWPLHGNKILGFDNHIRNLGYGTRVTVAFMKYCYIDFQPNTNVSQRWDEYRNTMEALETDYPNITFVWLTTALHNTGDGGDKREQFNNMLRQYCLDNGKVLYDVAAIESHDLEGNLCFDDFGNEVIYAGYATDGGHPTGVGQIRLASALWWLLARIAGWSVAPSTVELTTDTPILAANGTATAEITARLYDATNHIYIENMEKEITSALSGPGNLTGANPVMTENGTARIIYQAGSLIGKATITASAGGLSQGQVRIDLINNSAPDAPNRLLCNGQSDPTGVPMGYPNLTWSFNDTDADLGDTQLAYRVILADNQTDIDGNVGNVWDTGMVRSSATSASTCIVPLRSGIVHYWKVKTWDISGEEGPHSDCATFSLAGGLGYGLKLDPMAGSVSFGTDSSLDLNSTNGLAIEMWLYRTEENRESIILDKLVPGIGGYRVGVDASNHLYFRARGLRRDRRVVAMDATIPAGKWHHVACCRTGSAGGNDGIIYVDGMKCGMNGLINPPDVTSRDLCLEQSGIIIDELRISNTARYSGNFTPPVEPYSPDDNTVGLWHFDEGRGTTAEDSSSHNNTGTITPEHGWAAGYYRRTDGQQPKTADLNGDNKVDFVDFSLLASQWLQTTTELSADLNDDMIVDPTDLANLTRDWLKTTWPWL